MEMPQSGERIRGREKMREFQEAYPNPPAMRAGYPQGWSVGRGGRQGLRRGQVFHVVAIVELHDGKM
jgi:hypothetical protein